MYLVLGGAALIFVAPLTDFSNELAMAKRNWGRGPDQAEGRTRNGGMSVLSGQIRWSGAPQLDKTGQ